METMESICFGLWLNSEYTMFNDAYCSKDTNKMYYYDSVSDMNDLYELFVNSDYYKNTF